jgi:hypothetical protein
MAFADDDDDRLLPKPFVNSVIYGTAVGLIIGLAIQQGAQSIFRCTTFGFYGGILLGIYVDNQDSKAETPEQSKNPFSDSRGFSVTFRF